MSEPDSDRSPDPEWNERGELAWNEFDWERYLREQDAMIGEYQRHYESCRHCPDRIDAAAEKMGWSLDEEDDDMPDDSDDFDADEVYTLHKNPIYVSTKAIYRSLHRSWLALAADSSSVPTPLALAVLNAMHQGEERSLQAIYALEFGDYALAVTQFKRALGTLNGTLALVSNDTLPRHRAAAAWRDDALPRLFDLREIWLRVIAECRDELSRPIDGES